LATIAKYIDWGPFFIAWEMPGQFPAVLTDKIFGTEATRLFNDAKKLLDRIVSEKWFTANGVIGFWAAASNNLDTIILQTDKGEVHLECLRQQLKKAIGQPSFSLADFVKPSPSAKAMLPNEDTTKAPSQREEEKEFGYMWADPMTYPLLKEFSLKHRSNPTQAEDILWNLIKTKQLDGYKFRRQHIVGQYIADLVCLDRRLIVEIDGLIHELPENKESDLVRTEQLERLGFKILRVTNEQVINQPEETLKLIASTLSIQQSVKESPVLSSPFGGQGPVGTDYLGAFAVTIYGAKKFVEKFASEQDEYNKIMVQILADRFVEAFAECLHEKVRKEYWGYAKNENLTNEQLIKEEYTGIRPAPGYPACPDHTEKIKLFELLNVTDNIGIELTESLAMNPPASVCGWYIAHPDSHYFGLGKIGRDQLENYATRKRMTVEEAEKWLRPNLE
jgi:cobalamin-dependent methionine synthase I